MTGTRVLISAVPLMPSLGMSSQTSTSYRVKPPEAVVVLVAVLLRQVWERW
ncbi:MAG: hypothetical protein QM765_29510 [Myxococcales bacterium]